MENDRPKIEAVRVETPFGALESDSGNHGVNIVTIGAVLFLAYILKRLYFGK